MFRASIPVLAGVVHLKDFPKARLLTMENPSKLNALDIPMIDDMGVAYTARHPEPNFIYVLKGAGPKSFCSGGDIVSVVRDEPFGTREAFFYKEYQVNYKILTMKNAQVSLWNGFVMGGGVGVSIHGKYRVATEKANFAMPETAIGLFPDVGGSWFLPRMGVKGLGLYLGLTGARLKGTDLVHAGLATHFVPGSSIDKLEEELCNIADPSTVADCLSAHASKDLPAFSLEKHMPLIERVFTLKPDTTVEGILEGLKSDGSDFSKDILKTFSTVSPTSLKVSLELQKRGGAAKDPQDIFKMEYYASQRSAVEGDFKEGVRALLVDKTKDPKWNPATLADVTDEYVAKFFQPYKPELKEWHPVTPF